MSEKSIENAIITRLNKEHQDIIFVVEQYPTQTPGIDKSETGYLVLSESNIILPRKQCIVLCASNKLKSRIPGCLKEPETPPMFYCIVLEVVETIADMCGRLARLEKTLDYMKTFEPNYFVSYAGVVTKKPRTVKKDVHLSMNRYLRSQYKNLPNIALIWKNQRLVCLKLPAKTFKHVDSKIRPLQKTCIITNMKFLITSSRKRTELGKVRDLDATTLTLPAKKKARLDIATQTSDSKFDNKVSENEGNQNVVHDENESACETFTFPGFLEKEVDDRKKISHEASVTEEDHRMTIRKRMLEVEVLECQKRKIELEINDLKNASTISHSRDQRTFESFEALSCELRELGLDQEEVDNIESQFSAHKIKPQLFFALNDEKLKNIGLPLGVRDAVLYVLGKI
jgi:hypothetical protein